MKKYILILSLFISFISSATALLDFSDYEDNEKIDRKIERFYGVNPYNIAGILYTKSWNYSSDQSKQRDVDIHWGTNIVTWSVGVNVKKYWYDSKYKAISYFSSYSSSFALVLPMGGSKGPVPIDVNSVAAGIDFNVIRLNKFDIGFTAGLQCIGSFVLMDASPVPVFNISLSTSI
jgi:hypothetical protein